MSVINQFTQADTAPRYFIEFLDLLDNSARIQTQRAESMQRMNVSVGQKILDLGCGIGGATFRMADLVGPTGLVADVDLSTALIDVATRRAGGRMRCSGVV